MREARRAQGWLAAYLGALFAALPVALPWWNGGVREAVGRWLPVEAVHVLQYAGLGWLGAWEARAARRAGRARIGVLSALAGVGLLEEALQAWVPQRVFQWSDVGLNWAGFATGIMVFAAWQRARTSGGLRMSLRREDEP